MSDDYVLDVFQVACDKPRRIDWVMHVLGEKAIRTDGPELRAPLPPTTQGAGKWLRNSYHLMTGDPWSSAWRTHHTA